MSPLPFAHGPLVGAFGFGPVGSIVGVAAILTVALAAIAVTVVLKGFALWHAARNNQRNWFIALLIINALGILEIIYLIWFRPKTPVVSSSPQA